MAETTQSFLRGSKLEKKIVEFLNKTLPAKRLKHVFGVVMFAEKLAIQHRCNRKKAILAAACHDIARCWNKEKLVRHVKKNKLFVPDLDFTLKYQPVLMHSYVSADLSRTLFDVKDRQILSAVANHSLGAVPMSVFDKLIYLADLLARDRKFPGVSQLRRLALKDLDQAFIEGLRVKLLYVISRNERVHPQSLRVWNHFAPKSGMGT